MNEPRDIWRSTLLLSSSFCPAKGYKVSVRLETAVRGSGVLAYRPWDLLLPFPLEKERPLY